MVSTFVVPQAGQVIVESSITATYQLLSAEG